MLDVGAEFDGLRVVRPLGRRDGGTMFEAEQVRLRRHVAVLVLDDDTFPAIEDGSIYGAGSVAGRRYLLLRLDTEPYHAPATGRRVRPLAVGAILGAVAVVGVAALTSMGGATEDTAGAPPPARVTGSVAVGSALAPGPARSVDCLGQPPSVNSQACSIVQMALGGRDGNVQRAGVVRRWAVRGARGTLTIQVIRFRGRNGVQVLRSATVDVPDEGPHAFDADLPVQRGDYLAVDLGPGASIGVRSAARARTAYWQGPLGITRPPTDADASPVELLVRFDVVPGARRREPTQITGARAATLAAGRALGSAVVELPDGRERRFVLVSVGGIWLDMFAGARRVARIVVRDANPDGQLLKLERFEAGKGLHLRWQNPGAGRPIEHEYVPLAGRITFTR